MSLQTIAATVAATRPRGVRRYTVPLVLALAALALYDVATLPAPRGAPATHASAS